MASNAPEKTEKRTMNGGMRKIVSKLWPFKTKKHLQNQVAIVPQGFDLNIQDEQTIQANQASSVGGSRSLIDGFVRDELADGNEKLCLPTGVLYVTSPEGHLSTFQYTTEADIVGSLKSVTELSSEVNISDKTYYCHRGSEVSSYSSTLLGEDCSVTDHDKPHITKLVRYNPTYDATTDVKREIFNGYVRDIFPDGTEFMYSPRGKLSITSPFGELSEFEYASIPGAK